MFKRGQIWDTLVPWIIAIAVLVIIVVLAVLLKDKLIDMGSYLKELFRS